jgi:hypothetical protein
MILDSPPHVAKIFIEETVTDSYGNSRRQPSTNSVEVRCLISPKSSHRDNTNDLRMHELYTLITREAPIGNWSRVTFDDKSCSVDSIERHNVSPATAHVRAILRREL